jgi:hypothetical protein
MRLFSRRARRAGLAFAAAGVVAPIAPACSSSRGAPLSVSLAPGIVFPADVLQNAKSVGLTVYDQTKGVTCDGASGKASGVTSDTPKVTSTTLGPCPATSTGKFCGSLAITESNDTLIFAATALDAGGAAIAYGCAASIVSTAAQSVNITMVPNAPSATCGNGIIEATEQCDPPTAAGTTDSVCDSQCHSLEEVLSNGTTTPQGPAFAIWPAQSGPSGELLTFFADADPSGTGSADIALRVMSDSLEPVSNPPALAGAILAPNDLTSMLPPSPAPGAQSQPSAAEILGTYFYVFTDNSFGSPAIHMRSFDNSTFTGQQAQATPIVIDGPSAPVTPPDAGSSGPDGGVDGGAEGGGSNGPDGGAVQSTSPAIAADGTGSLFIAWQDRSGATAGQILGRTYTPTGQALGPINTVSAPSTTNENVRVAGTATGWLVVWDDSAQIKMRVFSGNGSPAGPEIIVSGANHTSTQDHPDIAVLADGRSAVVWADHGTSQGADIFVQRYDANYIPVPGDQTTPINDLVGAGDQVSPAIAGTTAASGSFVVAWLDVTSGDVRGRVLDGTKGFALNPVAGTTSEFKASLGSGVERENPFVAVGGAGPWALIGWDVAGVVTVRRFPTITETPQ